MKKNIGAAFVLFAAICWGFSGSCGQYIFDNFNADPSYLTAVRLLSSGVIMCVYNIFFNRKNMAAIWKDRRAALQLVLFACAGLMLCQLTYMKAISYSNSGTATILQYLGPLLVMIVSCIMAKRLPVRREVLAIIMALIGVFLIATHGDINNMVITPLGLSWGLFAAVALMLYTMLPGSLIGRFGSIVVTGYGMLIGGIFLSLICGVWNAPMIYDWRCIAAFAAIVIVGTIIPFTMYMWGLSQCGPVKASMLASIEPVSATVFMVVWLKEEFALMDFAGFACVLVMIFLLLTRDENRERLS